MAIYTPMQLHEIIDDHKHDFPLGYADPAWAEADQQYRDARKCGGCKKIVVDEAAHYCWNCGLDLTHILQRLIDVDLDTVPVSPLTRRSADTVITSEARSILRVILGPNKIKVHKTRGGHIRVHVPDAHDLDANPESCIRRDHRWNPWDRGVAIFGRVRDCYWCERHTEATRATQRILNAAFPELVDRSDYASDYFDFVWMVD